MEFGKKGDAKRAMKLHHKEGISLKQAWKRVKSGKKSKGRKKMSPKKRRAIKNAKKAMKLKWDKGITLKAAWRKVKKNSFGTEDCTQFKNDEAGCGGNPNCQWDPNHKHPCRARWGVQAGSKVFSGPRLPTLPSYKQVAAPVAAPVVQKVPKMSDRQKLTLLRAAAQFHGVPTKNKDGTNKSLTSLKSSFTRRGLDWKNWI